MSRSHRSRTPESLHTDGREEAQVDLPEQGQIVKIQTAIRGYVMAHRHTLAMKTLRGRRYTLESLAEFVGPDVPVRSIQAKHVNEWLQSQDVAASTMRKQLSAVKCLWAWLILSGYAKSDPTLGVKAPRQPRPLPRAMSPEEIAELRCALPDARAELIVSLMLHEGLRCAEVARLEMSDLDLVNGVMRVLGKGSVEALLPITPPTRAALDAYFSERGRGAGPVVRSETANVGITSAHIGALVQQWMTDAGLKQGAFDGVSAHALRHTMATTLMNRDVDLRVISDALRHSSPSTTWTYLRHHRSLEALREVMGKEAPPPREGSSGLNAA